MSETLTLAQLEADFPGEWLLIADPVTDEQLNILAGRVVHHSADLDEVDHAARSTKAGRLAIIFTGRIPEGVEVVL
jgi:hypothetical protein